MNDDFAIEVIDLRKHFGELQAVQGISFTACRGEVFSLLGPNGAGKSTTISMLSGLLESDEGEARIMGHSVRSQPEAAKAALGVVPQDIALYPDLTARENLVFWGKMYNLRGAALKQRVDEEVESVQDTLGESTAMTGFYSYGEICPVEPDEKQAELHNQTMTITTFSEK